MTRFVVPAAVALFCAALAPPACARTADAPSPGARYAYEYARGQAEKHGWACVAAQHHPPGKGFAYSIGLSSKQLPELGVFDVDDVDKACFAIGRVAAMLIAAGSAPRNGAEIFRNGEGRVVLRAVRRKQFYDLCTFAKRWRDEHHIPDARAMQILVLDPGEPMPR